MQCFLTNPIFLKSDSNPKNSNGAKKNEPGMWTYLIEHKLLFNSDRMTIVRFIKPGAIYLLLHPGFTGKDRRLDWLADRQKLYEKAFRNHPSGTYGRSELPEDPERFWIFA